MGDSVIFVEYDGRAFGFLKEKLDFGKEEGQIDSRGFGEGGKDEC